jgi:voltage-gated potassium channel
MKEGTAQEEAKNNVLKVLTALFIALLTVGTLGFMFLKGLSLWEAFYQTTLILVTHFYHEIHEPVSIQILILLIILGSLVIVAYIIKFFAEYFFEGTFKEKRKRRVMEKTINSYHDHYIICGYGRVGRQIAEELHNEKKKFIVVDRDLKEAKAAESEGFAVVNGDPTEERTLLKAGILKAKSVIVVPGSEVDSLYIVLSARSLNPDIFIIARASREEGIAKIKKAGANKVTMPEQIAGYHMATMALRPAVIDFLDVIVDGKHDELQIEELKIRAGSEYINRPLSFYQAQTENSAAVLAINRVDGSTKVNPGSSEIMNLNDKLILMGTREELEKMTDKVV